MENSRRLLKWYNDLDSRTLDLVGDYAGNELFLVEGDSLLLHCFSDDQLDFSPGLQLLHAAYIVEKFLAQLQQRKCNFHIVFFSTHAHLCIPKAAEQMLWPRYLLAREAIILHLEQTLPGESTSIHVKKFAVYDDPDFEKYLASVGAYFVMCHDGAFAETTTKNFRHATVLKDLDGHDKPLARKSAIIPWPSHIMLRSMIHWFICHGLSVSLLNSVQCHDTKVMAVVLESSAKNTKEQIETKQSSDLCPPAPSPEVEDLQLIIDSSLLPKLTQREGITLLSLATILKSSRSDTDIILARTALVHVLVLQECRVCDRAIMPSSSKLGSVLLGRYAVSAVSILTSPLWHKLIVDGDMQCDVADLLDGRLFLDVLGHLEHSRPQDILSASGLAKFGVLSEMLKRISGVDINNPIIPLDRESRQGLADSLCRKRIYDAEVKDGLVDWYESDQKPTKAVLPFKNPVFDLHLTPISLTIDDAAEDEDMQRNSKIFQELSHWHSKKRLLGRKAMSNLSDWQRMQMNRRHQRLMAEMRDYATSLTGTFNPQVIMQSTNQHQKNPGQIAKTSAWKANNAQHNKGKPKGITSVREQIAAQAEEKRLVLDKKLITQWTSFMRAELESKDDLTERYLEAAKYLSGLGVSKKRVLGVEVMMYMVKILVGLWERRCIQNRKSETMHIMALLWKTILQIAEAKSGVTQEIASTISKITGRLGLPSLRLQVDGRENDPFQHGLLDKEANNVKITLSPVEFQLVHSGPYMARNMGSLPDPRVPDFEPDTWQRKILDLIDARKSLFVVAPTSAGKTFISFYAIKQILEDSEDGVIVYVAPTKALVNQIAAEVMARFSKDYKNAGKSVWAIHTRDYRVNNPVGCQVLITVPHILQIMLLAPSNSQSWSPRVKRIIFDEIHCIGQADDGVVWEQLLLLAPCPIIALSATVGNPTEFSKWLSLTQKSNGNELEMVEHKTRWSDLRKYTYHPPRTFLFGGFAQTRGINNLGIDACPNMAFVHPVASLIDRSRGIPDDLTLEPRDCWTLWKAVEKYQTGDFPLDASLDPSVALPDVIAKADVIEWESKLKAVLKRWMADKDSPFAAVLGELSSRDPALYASDQVSHEQGFKFRKERKVNEASLLSTILPLICSLHEQGALPALVFNYDRDYCERLCRQLLEELQSAEEDWKSSSKEWGIKIAKWEAWKKGNEKQRKEKEPKGKKKGSHDGERVSKEDNLRESASCEPSMLASFDPEEPLSRFILADERKLSATQFEKYAQDLRNRSVHEWLISALKRGIGVHHSGMNRKYRHICETLFRSGYLKVVIATGTLALGINMPCKTVVFAGDSVFLTALGFRQAAGRAGRRGFDFLGNIVFQCISHAKVCRLLSSKLPDLNGHFPITTSLVLRLFVLLHESGNAPFAVNAINSILSCPRIYLGGPESRHTVLHHLRFSIEYLRRNNLISRVGAPLNFAGAITHLYYTENSSFAFHALLSGGYFHTLSKDIHLRPEEVLRTLILVMAHLFGRFFLRQSVLEQHEANKKSPSVVILPPLPANAMGILKDHNQKTLEIYSSYVTTFIDSHITSEDCTLPLTNTRFGGDNTPAEVLESLNFLAPTKVTSPFIALSGHRDTFTSIADLCKKVRSGVWLEESVVPYVEVSREGTGTMPLNAYLYDFFRHGNVNALHNDNHVRKGDTWFVLKDFSLVLATIVTSFENFFKLNRNEDGEFDTDVVGSGDASDEETERDVMDEMSSLTIQEKGNQGAVRAAQGQTTTLATVPSARPKKKDEVLDSWEDDLSDDDDNDAMAEIVPECLESRETKCMDKGSTAPTTMEAVFEDGGLRDVLKMFKMLQQEFDDKFHAIWA